MTVAGLIAELQKLNPAMLLLAPNGELSNFVYAGGVEMVTVREAEWEHGLLERAHEEQPGAFHAVVIGA